MKVSDKLHIKHNTIFMLIVDYVVRCSVDQLDEIQGRLLANDGKGT